MQDVNLAAALRYLTVAYLDLKIVVSVVSVRKQRIFLYISFKAAFQ
jgi:hypothetical protein